MPRQILQFSLILMLPTLMAMDLRGEGNLVNVNGGNNDVCIIATPDPIDLATGHNMVDEAGLQLATPGIPLSFDLHYNSGNYHSGDYKPPNPPGILGRGWDLSLNWQLSIRYVIYPYTPPCLGSLGGGTYDIPTAEEYGAKLSERAEDNLFHLRIRPTYMGPFSTNIIWTNSLVVKTFLISDGTMIYRVPGGVKHYELAAGSDWDLNGGHYYFETPVDWELVHTNSEYRLLFPGKKWLTFSDDGRVSAMGDAWGNTVIRSRDGDTETWAHSNGRWVKLIYGASNLVSEIQTDDGRGMRFTYTNDCMASMEWYGGAKSRTHYYSYENNRLVERINAEGTISQYDYDGQGKAISVNVASNWYRHTVTYGSVPQVTFYGHGTNWNEDFQFDGLGRLSGRIGPWNSGYPKGQLGIYYTYDKWRNNIGECYFEGTNTAILTSRYNDYHHLLENAIGSGTNEARQLFTMAWSEEDKLPSSTTNADGLGINFEYMNGAISSTRINRGGLTEETTMSGWDARGMPGTVRDARGAETYFTYNTYGQVEKVQLPSRLIYGYEYDSAGQVKKLNRLDTNNVATTLAEYERDGFGQITKATYRDGLFEQFAYDPMRRITNAVDRAGRQMSVEYWPIGKIKSVTRSAGADLAQVRFDYDEQGTDLKITDELGRIVEAYALDVAGRPKAVTNILGQTMQINYAIFDLRQQINRFDGSSVSFTYDTAWRLASIIYPDDTINMTYSAGDLLQTVSDQSGMISNKYDSLLRWAGQTGPRSWDEITVVNGTGGLPTSVSSAGGTVTYGYYPCGRLKTISGQGGTFKWIYNTTNGLPSAILSLTNGASSFYLYDNLDRLSGITWKDPSSNAVRSFGYSYNAVGMITQKVTTANGLQSTNFYSYDNLDRLISESAFSPQSSAVSLYSYDLAGNRTQMVANGQIINYTLSSGNRLTSWGTSGENTMSYNMAGCVTEINLGGGNIRTLAWDSRYRLTSVVTNGATAESYGYDALDRRISISDGTTTNYLVYNGVHCIAETDSSGNLQRSYTYGPGIDNMLSMTVYGVSTSTYYYVKDHLDSIQAIVDSSGSVIESYKYDVWGNVLGVYNSSNQLINESTIGNRFLFQGREYSWKTGLYYFRARWYEPVTGRWLSNDPIGISGGLNQYVFCGDNPVTFDDHFGLRGESSEEMPWWEKLERGYYYGTGYGESAVQYYVAITLDPNASWYEITGAYIGGSIASLWTPENYQDTGWTLVSATCLSGGGPPRGGFRRWIRTSDPPQHGIGPHDHFFGRRFTTGGPRLPGWGRRGAEWRGWGDWARRGGGWGR